MTQFDLAWHPSLVPDGSCFPCLFIGLLAWIGPSSKVRERRGRGQLTFYLIGRLGNAWADPKIQDAAWSIRGCKQSWQPNFKDRKGL